MESPTSLRQYYPGVPLEIEVGTHSYLDAPLLEFFSTCKTFAWYDNFTFGFSYFKRLTTSQGLIHKLFPYIQSVSG